LPSLPWLLLAEPGWSQNNQGICRDCSLVSAEGQLQDFCTTSALFGWLTQLQTASCWHCTQQWISLNEGKISSLMLHNC